MDMHDRVEIRVTSSRWWILGVFSVFTFMEGMIWAVPGPISDSTASLYGWSDGVTSLMLNWGPIFFVVTSLPLAWLSDGNLRHAMLFSSFLVTLGAVVRLLASYLLPVRSTALLVLMHVSWILNAIAGPVSMGAIVRLSQLWFPPKERALATSIGTEANMIGVGIAFALAPAVFPNPGTPQDAIKLWWVLAIPSLLAFLAILIYFPAKPKFPPSESARLNRVASLRQMQRKAPRKDGKGGGGEKGGGGGEKDEKEEEEEEEGGGVGGVGGGVDVGLEERLLDDAERLLDDADLEWRVEVEDEEAGEEGGAPVHVGLWGRLSSAWENLVILSGKRQFWVLFNAYGLATGIYSGWAPLLAINLKSIHMSQALAGWIGFSATIAGCVAGLGTGFVLERLRKAQWILTALMAVSTLSFAVFAVVAGLRGAAIESGDHDAWVMSDAAIYVLVVAAAIAGACLNSSIPAYYEAAVEAAFPLEQSFIGIMLANANNLYCGAYLVFGSFAFFTSVPQDVIMTTACAAVVVAFVTVYKEVQARREIDDARDGKQDTHKTATANNVGSIQ